MSVSELEHPSRILFRGRPDEEWVEACERAMNARRAFVESLVLEVEVEVDDKKLETCRKYWREFADLSPAFLRRWQLDGKRSAQDFLNPPPVPPRPPSPDPPKPPEPARPPSPSPPPDPLPRGVVMILDTETTGLGANDVVIQIGFVLCHPVTGQVLFEHERIWRANRPSHPKALEVHQIPDELVRTSEHDPAENIQELGHLIRHVQEECKGVVVAHNASFDVKMLRQTAAAAGTTFKPPRHFFCTMQAIRALPVATRGDSARNEAVYRFLGGPALSGRLHQALADVHVTKFVYFTGRSRRWW